ncbi:hypothetical protein PIB30_039447 [Stylosanthes scabra]|uniref:Uncharacterized protein n=1 Tax=Stylosanthes scabra TaxID=79078 RepID=A0ABU6UFJ7_9FABA|nr:hypothetical protein [Stylosanthes scabra]
MEKQTQQSEDPFPVFDGKEGYGWTICIEQYWNARGTPEQQRFMEMQKKVTVEQLLIMVAQNTRPAASQSTSSQAPEKEEAHESPPKPPNLSSEGMVGDKAADLCLMTMPSVSSCKTANVATTRGTAGDRVTDLNKVTNASTKGISEKSSVQADIASLEDDALMVLGGSFQAQGFRRIFR